jgi:hypothetical protein
VDRHDDLDVVQERCEAVRILAAVAQRREVVVDVGRVEHRVARGIGPCRRRCGDDVGHLLESAAVKRHQSERRAQLTPFDHARSSEQLAQRLRAARPVDHPRRGGLWHDGHLSRIARR